jgi:hypothetical protein
VTRAPSRTVFVVDRLFRVAGVVVVVALAVTGAMLALGQGAWRVPFVAAHLAALIALVPLGLALVFGALRDGAREGGSPAAAPGVVWRRYRLVTVLVLLTFVTVAITLSQFSGGVRGVRVVSNLATVAIVLTLVARYLRRGPPGRAAGR